MLNKNRRTRWLKATRINNKGTKRVNVAQGETATTMAEWSRRNIKGVICRRKLLSLSTLQVKTAEIHAFDKPCLDQTVLIILLKYNHFFYGTYISDKLTSICGDGIFL